MGKKSDSPMSSQGWYRIYWGMRNRCENPNVAGYKYYGGRGISVCEEWHDPRVFGKWAIENGYEKGLSIERIDVNKGYCPSNCKWIPRNEQGFNRSDSTRFTKDGVTKTRKQWEKDEGAVFQQINIRMDEELRDALVQIAEAKGVSVATLITEMLCNYVERRKIDKGDTDGFAD